MSVCYAASSSLFRQHWHAKDSLEVCLLDFTNLNVKFVEAVKTLIPVQGLAGAS